MPREGIDWGGVVFVRMFKVKKHTSSSQMHAMPSNVTWIENGGVGATGRMVAMMHSELFKR